jgi:hypothetical protein
LSDLANATTARTNLGATSIGHAMFTTANTAAAQGIIGVSAIGAAAVGQIPGIAGSTQPAAGFVGELLIASVSLTFAGSGTVGQAASLPLTPGVWDMESFLVYSGPGATTTSDVQCAISATSGSVSV